MNKQQFVVIETQHANGDTFVAGPFSDRQEANDFAKKTADESLEAVSDYRRGLTLREEADYLCIEDAGKDALYDWEIVELDPPNSWGGRGHRED